jgi:ABC-type transport system involved in cytochrome c biogenesis permease subunit
MELSTTLAFGLVGLGAATSLVGFAVWFVPRLRRLHVLGDALGLACLALSLVAWILRWWHAGHLPLFGTFESSLSLGVAVLLVALLFRLRVREGLAVWPVACLTTTAIVAHGLGFDKTMFALTISERSWVVDVHAVLAWLAFGTLAANAGFGLRRLLRREAGRPDDDRMLALTLSLGFVLHSAMLASGSLYKFLLFGRAWSFDPVETLGFATWLAYGALLHLHLIGGWQGRRLARWCLGLFILLIVSYRGIVYFPPWSTYHIFDMDRRIHLTGSEPFEQEIQE